MKFNIGDRIMCVDFSGSTGENLARIGRERIHTVLGPYKSKDHMVVTNLFPEGAYSKRFVLIENLEGEVKPKSETYEKETTGKQASLAVKNLIDSGSITERLPVSLKIDEYVITIKKRKGNK